jgi:hypothetical protein
MPEHSEITVPLHAPPSWMPCRRHFLLATDESIGSQADTRGHDRILIIEDELFRLHGIRCIFASAYSSDREVRRRAGPAAPVAWLQKPFTMASLADVVRAGVKELRRKSR